MPETRRMAYRAAMSVWERIDKMATNPLFQDLGEKIWKLWAYFRGQPSAAFDCASADYSSLLSTIPCSVILPPQTSFQADTLLKSLLILGRELKGSKAS
jgi:hypothetical protein